MIWERWGTAEVLDLGARVFTVTAEPMIWDRCGRVEVVQFLSESAHGNCKINDLASGGVGIRCERVFQVAAQPMILQLWHRCAGIRCESAHGNCKIDYLGHFN